jgi:hypothetical protein
MAAICTECKRFRLDGRTMCKCGESKHIYTLITLNLRCEWCKDLFTWKLREMNRIPDGIRRCCTNSCAAKLRHWEKERKNERIESVVQGKQREGVLSSEACG